MRVVKNVIALFVILAFFCTAVKSYAKKADLDGKIPDNVPTDIKMLIEKLYSDIPGDPVNAAYALGKKDNRSRGAVPFIIEVFNEVLKTSPEDVNTLKIFINALGEIKEKDAANVLISVLENNKDEDLRRFAVIALGRIQDPRAVEPLIVLLGDDFHIKIAVRSLVLIGKGAVEPLIRAFEKNSDPIIQENAAFTLGKIGDSRAVEPFIKAFKVKDKLIKKSAIKALGAIKNVTAVEPLLELLKEDDWEIMKTAAFALGEIKDPRAFKPLRTLLDNKDERVKVGAIRALGALTDKRAVEPLMTILLKSRSWNIKRYTAWALKNITGKSYGYDHDEWRKWYEQEGNK